MSQSNEIYSHLKSKATLQICILYGFVAAVLSLYLLRSSNPPEHAPIIFWTIVGWALACFLHLAMTTVRRSQKVKMITCVIRPEQLNEVARTLKKEDFLMGMTVMDVRGFGRQKGEINDTIAQVEQTIKFLPKLKLEILVRDWDANKAVDVIANTLRTGNIGDGKIVVYAASSAMRVRTGETGVRAL